jgi:hypothetical protein
MDETTPFTPRAWESFYVIVGGSALLLVFIGIHNAWDTVAYVTLERARERKAKATATEAGERRPASGSAPAAGKGAGPSGPPPTRNP